MSSYAALLEEMMQAILSSDTSSAQTLYRDKADFSAQEQLAVYVRGYRLRLHKIFKNMYPATQHYLGADAFKAKADAYINATPSHTFNIDSYAIALGKTTSDNDDCASELLHLESALREVYHLPESPPLEKEWLKQQTPESLANAPLQVRTASRLLAFSYPISDYITAFRAGENPEKPSIQPTWLIILRDGGDMQRVTLEEAEYALLTLISQGYSLGAAMASEHFAPYADEQLGEHFQRWLAHWLSEGIFTAPQ